VAEFDDTRRFNPSAPLPPDTTNPLYASAAAAYVAPQAVPAPLYRTASFARKLFKRKWVWGLLLMALLAMCFAIGVEVGSDSARGNRGEGSGRAAARNERNVQEARRLYEEAVQNALGFMQGRYSASEFPNTPGILVNSLMSDDSPAALARIQAGDLMTELNNQPVRNNGELSQALDALKSGEEVPVKLVRDGEVVSLRIKIGDRHFPPLQPKLAPRDQGFLGVLDSARRCCLPGTKKWGVEVSELHVNGPAELFGLRPGDVITEFNGHPVKTPNEFNRRIRAVKPGSKAPVTFHRGNTQQKIEVVLGRRW
jgi:PDZ domain-containing secreted protein